MSFLTYARYPISRPFFLQQSLRALRLHGQESTKHYRRPFSANMSLTAQELNSYLADSPPSVVRLEIAKHFDALTDKQKRYAHFISQ